MCDAKTIKERSKNYKDPSTGYIRALHNCGWGGNDYYILGKDENEETGLSLLWNGDNNRGDGYKPDALVVENVFEELDCENEWFYDSKTGILYVYPSADIRLESSVISAAVSTEIIRIVGKSHENPVKDISIRGIDIVKTARSMFASRNEGKEYISLLRGDWCVARTGAVYIENAENISLSDINFLDLGGNAVFCYGYNSGHIFDNNEMINLGASGVQIVGCADAVDDPSYWEHKNYPDHQVHAVTVKHPDIIGPVSENYPRDITVSNTHIQNIGIYEKQSSGVNVSVASRIKILHNTIHKSARSCINVNDGSFGGHDIAFNDVFNSQLETTDHGPFNSWGRDRYWSVPNFNGGGEFGEIIRNYNGYDISKLDAYQTISIHDNRFHHDFSTGHSWGIDLDDGSANYEIYNNLILGIGIKLREGFDRVVHNNIIVDGKLEIHVPYAQARDRIYSNIFIGSNPWGFAGCDDERFYKTEDFVDRNWYFNFGGDIYLPGWSYVNDRQNPYDINAVLNEDPEFKDVSHNDYTVLNSDAMKTTGFINFEMNEFGKPGCPYKSPVFVKNTSDTAAKPLFKAEWKGAVISDMDDGIMSSTGSPNKDGVYFEKVPSDSEAFRLGFRDRDIAREINSEKTESAEKFISLTDSDDARLKIKVFRTNSIVKIEF